MSDVIMPLLLTVLSGGMGVGLAWNGLRILRRPKRALGKTWGGYYGVGGKEVRNVPDAKQMGWAQLVVGIGLVALAFPFLGLTLRLL